MLSGVLSLLAAVHHLGVSLWDGEEDSPMLLTAEAWLSLRRALADAMAFPKSRPFSVCLASGCPVSQLCPQLAQPGLRSCCSL